MGSGPDAELGAALRFDPVADRDDNIQVIIFCFVFFPIRGSSQVFLDNCILSQLPFFKYITDMEADILLGLIKKLD